MTKNINKRLDAIEEHLGINTPKTTRILVIQDKSSSMGTRAEETISGFNEYVKDLQKDTSDEAFLTLVQFDTSYNIIYDNEPVEDVEPLNTSTYSPGGMTALLDAVGRGLDTLKKQMNDGDRALVVIMTDGQENSSQEYDSAKIKKMISRYEEKGNYTFVFMGAGTGSWTGGEMLGLRREQSVWYGEDSHSHGVAYAGLSGMTSGLRGSVAMASPNSGTVTSRAMKSAGANVELEDEAPLWTPGEEDTKDKENE